METLFFFELNGESVRIGKCDFYAGEKNDHQPGDDDPDQGIGIDHANTNIAGKKRKLECSGLESVPLQEVGNDLPGFLAGFLQIVVDDDIIEMVTKGNLIGGFIESVL